MNCYGQVIVYRRVAIDFDAPAKFQFSKLLNRRGDIKQIAGLHNVWIVFDPANEAGQAKPVAVPKADDEIDNDAIKAAPPPRIRLSGGTIDQLIIGSGIDAKAPTLESLGSRLNVLLHDEVAAIDKVCTLTKHQRSKLMLAGRGDIQHFFDRAEDLKSRFEQTADVRTEDEFCRWAAPLGAEAEKLGRLLDAGLFDVNSLLSKTLNSTLSRDQRDRLVAEPLGIRVPEFPKVGWIDGPAPEIEGKPYLIYFWAARSAGSKAKLPVLKNLVDEGATVIGIHPVPLPSDEIAEFIREEQISFPTLTGSDRVVGVFMRIKTCPVKQLPYCIVVDRSGLVAGFGMFGPELLAKFGGLRRESATGSKN